VVGLFELFDVRMYRVVISPHYGDATDDGNPIGHARGHGNHARKGTCQHKIHTRNENQIGEGGQSQGNYGMFE
jgi:hypothetical protein